MNDKLCHRRRPAREGISRAAVNPSLEAARKTSLPRNRPCCGRFLGAIRPRPRGCGLFFTPREMPSRSVLLRTVGTLGRVEMWRGDRRFCLNCCRPFRLTVSQSASRNSVSTSRSSNRTGGFPASGSRTRLMRSPTGGYASGVADAQDREPHKDTRRGNGSCHCLASCACDITTDAAGAWCIGPAIGMPW
jgi:hypothetical protein